MGLKYTLFGRNFSTFERSHQCSSQLERVAMIKTVSKNMDRPRTTQDFDSKDTRAPRFPAHSSGFRKIFAVTFALASLLTSAFSQTVTIPDAGLNAAIRETLGKPSGLLTA